MISDKTNAIGLAAAPAFAIMAVLTRFHDGDMPAMLCSATAGRSLLDGMFPMYLLMAAFHSPPWLRLLSRLRKRRTLNAVARGATEPRSMPPDSPARLPRPRAI